MTDANQINRRRFIELAAVATGALVAACGGRGVLVARDAGLDAALDGPAPSRDTGPDGDANVTGLPHLGGAPDTRDGRTIAAFADTVVPGRFRDPTGAVGAIDVGVPGLFFDPALPALPLVPALAFLLDAQGRTLFQGRSFVALSVAERERALDAGVMSVPELDFAIQLVKLAFYSSQDAGRALGYPGANPGYVRDPDFSFNRAMAREITTDGNLP